MRAYFKVSPQFWLGQTGRELRKLDPECTVVAMYLMTCPHANSLGLYYIPLPYIAHETGSTLEEASKALASLSEAGFCVYDHENEFVWVRSMARHQIGALKPRDNRVKAIRAEYGTLTSNSLLPLFFDEYADMLHLEHCRGEEEKVSPFEAPSKPLRSSLSLSLSQSLLCTPPTPSAGTEETEEDDPEIQGALSRIADISPSHLFEYYKTQVREANMSRGKFPEIRPQRQLTSSAEKAIQARLAEGYTVEDLQKAIRGCLNTPWYRGLNSDGMPKVSLINIFKSDDKVEEFIAQSEISLQETQTVHFLKPLGRENIAAKCVRLRQSMLESGELIQEEGQS